MAGKKPVDETKMEDRMSELPDDILLGILSFLPMYQVVRTSILSRRWRHLWAQVPVLDFGTHKPPFRRWNDIESSINRCLMLYNARTIKKFHVRVDCTRIQHRNLQTWLQFALKRDVAELDMDYIGAYRGDDHIHEIFFYPMPGWLYQYSGALRALRLKGCFLNLPASFSLGWLRTLELYNVICGPDFNTSGFPLLESLTLHGCNRKTRFSIYCPHQKLQKLKISDVSDVLGQSNGLIIDAPHLLSIEIGGYMRVLGCTIKNLSSATRACLDFTCMFEVPFFFPESYMLVKLLESLGHVKSLKLCQRCILDVALRGKSILSILPFSTKCLELGTSLNRWEIKGMAHLLNNSHYLETLIVDIQILLGHVRHDYDDIITESEGWNMLELAMSSLSHLRTVRICDFFCTATVEASLIIDEILEDCETEIKLLKVILKSCKMLDKMFISAIKTQDPIKWMIISELLLILTEELQNFPRVSANAEIYLS